MNVFEIRKLKDVRIFVLSGIYQYIKDVPQPIANLKDLEEWRDVIPEYVKDYVSLNTFM